MISKSLSADIGQMSQSILDGSEPLKLTVQTTGNLWAYRQNHIFAHIKRLESTFTSVRRVTGERNFKFFALRHLNSFPSRSENLDDFGAEFWITLEASKEIESMGYLSGLAKLDWFYYQGREGQVLEVHSGTFDLWSKVLLEQDFTGYQVFADQFEKVALEIENDERYLTKIYSKEIR